MHHGRSHWKDTLPIWQLRAHSDLTKTQQLLFSGDYTLMKTCVLIQQDFWNVFQGHSFLVHVNKDCGARPSRCSCHFASSDFTPVAITLCWKALEMSCDDKLRQSWDRARAWRRADADQLLATQNLRARSQINCACHLLRKRCEFKH